MTVRKERDALGEREIPAEAYYGIHTARALEIFAVSGLKTHPEFIRAYAMVKKAAALTNTQLGQLPEQLGQAIASACDEILAGRFHDQVPIDIFQAGAGTTLNMNLNEVIANRAIEILGGQKGDYHLVHPNDHVNMAQSTNDTFPTAMRLAALQLLARLHPVLAELGQAFKDKAGEFDRIVKSGRTHLQDAVPIRLGQEFAAYACTIGKAKRRIEQASHSLTEVGLGGTAVGTGLNAHPEYRQQVVQNLSDIADIRLRPAQDMREAMQSNLAIAEISGALKLLALELTRIANDLRLLSSGPCTGLAEISLPPVQLGSSIMPGKINPTMAEMLNMVAFQVLGNDSTISQAVAAGQLELNVMMPVMAANLFNSIEILTNALALFTSNCVAGIEANEKRCAEYAETSLGLATVLAPHLGYDEAARLVKESQARGVSIKELLAQSEALSAEKRKQLLDMMALTEPGIPGKKV
jgi:aspartate ammonia-lyase